MFRIETHPHPLPVREGRRYLWGSFCLINNTCFLITPLPHREGQGGESSISSLFYSYLGAYILVALSGCLGNVVDGIIVGNLISEDGVSAINLSKPINQFIYTLQLLINAGAGMLVAYALGQKDIAQARRFFTRGLILSIGVSLLLSIFGGILFPDETARMLCSNEQILPLARDYMQVLLLGNPAFILMWGLSTMVGVDGKPKLVSAAVIIDNAVNLLLDIVFIQCFGWGITGSSAATVVGHIVGIAILLSHWWNPANRRLTPVFSFDGLLYSWRRILSQGAPLAIASISLTLLMLSANTIVLSTLGRTGIFAFAVCMNLLQVYNLFLSGTFTLRTIPFVSPTTTLPSSSAERSEGSARFTKLAT